MGTQVHDAQWRAKLFGDQVAGRLRDENLAAVTGRADACRAMDVQPDVALRRPHRLAGMQAHPVEDRDPIGPGVTGNRQLPVHGRKDRGARRMKDEVEPVAGRTPLERTVARERLPDQPVMVCEHLRVAVPKRLEQAGRTLDVREHQGDGSSRLAVVVGGLGLHPRSSGLDGWSARLPHDLSG